MTRLSWKHRWWPVRAGGLHITRLISFRVLRGRHYPLEHVRVQPEKQL